MSTLTLLRRAMTEFLTGQGVRALPAWPEEGRKVRTEPLAVVQMQEVEAVPAGFQNYLGQTFDQETQSWNERYGQRITVKFGLDLYSPERQGEEGCRLLLDQVAGAFQRGGPMGLSVKKWSMGEPGFDTESGMFRGKLTAECQGTLEAVSSQDGAFLGFEVKGGMRT